MKRSRKSGNERRVVRFRNVPLYLVAVHVNDDRQTELHERDDRMSSKWYKDGD